jgi:MYXO-CTERM domain-containing protein
MRLFTGTVSIAVLLMLGRVTPALAIPVVFTASGCSVTSGGPVLTDIPTGFTVTGTLQLSVPDGSSDCSLSWLAERPLNEIAGTPTTNHLNLQFAIDLPANYSSDILLLASTQHKADGVILGPDSFAALLFIQTIVGPGNALSGQSDSQTFLDQGGADGLDQQFSIDMSTSSAATISLNFTLTSTSTTAQPAPEPSGGLFALSGLAGLAVRMRRRSQA